MRRGFAVAAILVVVVGLLAFTVIRRKSAALTVKVLQVGPAKVVRVLAVTGQVEAVSRADLSSPLSNVQALQVLVDKGSQVTAGQPVILLDARSLRAAASRSHALLLQARASLLQAQAQEQGATHSFKLAVIALHDNTDLNNQVSVSAANAASMRAQLVIAQQNDQKVREGARQQAVNAAEAQLQGAQAQLALARANFSRATNLHKQGALAQSDLDAARAAFLSAKFAVTSAGNQLQELRVPRTQDVVQADEAVTQARANLSAALQTLAANKIALHNSVLTGQAVVQAKANMIADRATVAAARAAMQAALEQYVMDAVQEDKTVLRSPITGVVTARSIQPGEVVTAGQSLLSFAAPGNMRIRADVDETDLHEIHPGEPVVVAPDAYPTLRLPARVSQIVPQADNSNGTVEVRVALLKPSSKLLPHLTADLNITTGVFTNALAIPRDAVLHPDGDAQVYVVNNGRATLRKVDVTSGGEGVIVVLSGLSSGDLVVTNPALVHVNQRVTADVVQAGQATQ